MTKEEALALAATDWWKTKTPEEIVRFQLFEEKLCMNFSEFHKAIEQALGRPVYTHEFGLNRKGLQEEFLHDKPAPTIQEIIEMIPEAKRILVVS